jgi:glycosyltransferase involved in cell wall biosynthesis
MKKKTKVLFLVSNYPSEKFPDRGIFFKRMVKGLSNKGVEVCVIAPVPYSNWLIELFINKLKGYTQIPLFALEDDVKIYRPKYFRFPFIHKLYLSHFFQLYLIRKILNKENPDIIDFRTSYPPYPLSSVVLKIHSEFKIPYIYTINGIHLLPEDETNTIKRKNFIKLIDNASKVLSVSVQLSNSIQILSKKNVELTIHPIDFKELDNSNSEKNSEISNIFLNDSNVFCYLFVGELTYEKGVDTLLETFLNLNLPNIKLLLVGDGKLFKSVSSCNIEFLGKLPNSDVIQLMRKVNCFIFPTRYEGMPNVLKEAGALGLPIIASKAGGIPELLNMGERGYLLEDVSYSAIKESIIYTLNSLDIMRDKSDKLKRYLKENYDVDRTSAVLKQMYLEIINSN